MYNNMTYKQKYLLVRNSITKTHIPQIFDELVKGSGGGRITEIYYKAPKKVRFETLVDCDNDFIDGAGKLTIYGTITNFSLGKYATSSSDTGTSVLDDTCELTDITELIIPEGILKTLENVLPEGSDVEVIELPDSLIEIGENSFNNLKNLIDINIGSNVTSIGANAFAYSGAVGSGAIGSGAIIPRALMSLDIPNSVVEIGENAFGGIDNINYTGIAEDDGEHWGALYRNAYVEKPIIYEDDTKTHILKCNTNPINTTTTIDIPSTVTVIDEDAFSLMLGSGGSSGSIGASILQSGIIEVNVPNNVTSVGENSFALIPNVNYTGELENAPWGALNQNATVDIPYMYEDSDKTRGLYMMYDYIDDKEVILPASITSIAEGFTDRGSAGIGLNYFIENEKLYQITLPNIIQIDGDCFNNVPNVIVDNSQPTEHIQSMYINKYEEDGIIYEDDAKTAGLKYLRTNNVTFSTITLIGSEFASLNNYLKAINLPNCTHVNIGAFYNCSALTSIDLPNCVYVRDSAFNNCSSLTSIDLPNCTYIEYGAFEYCSSLASVNLPSCTYISSNAFESCSALASIDLSSCAYIESNAFTDCTALTAIDLPNCTYIDYGAFYSCSALTSIDLPSCTYISGSAFEYCSSLAAVNLPSCTYISGSAFESCSALTSVDLPSCTYIDVQAFDFCTALATIDLPSCTYINNGAFVNCYSLTSVNLQSCTYIESDAFNSCSSLTAIKLANNIDYLGGGAFDNCSSLTAIDLPNCTYIDYSAFYSCSALTYIDLQSCTYIESDAFNSCSSLTAIKLANNIDYLGGGAFDNCSSLTSVFGINDLLFNRINDIVYDYKNRLYKIDGYVTTLNRNILNDCTSLVYVDFPNCTYTYSDAFARSYSLTAVNLPACTQIGNSAFINCSSLTSIELPSVNYISHNAFQYCTSLKYVVIDRVTVPSFGTSIFANCNSLTAIFVPDTCVTAYQNAANLTTYASLVTGISYM